MVTIYNLVELLKTAEPAQLMVIKSVLDSAEIPYLVQGEQNLNLNPSGLSGGFFNHPYASVWVRREDRDDARALLATPLAGSDVEE